MKINLKNLSDDLIIELAKDENIKNILIKNEVIEPDNLSIEQRLERLKKKLNIEV